MNYANTPGSAEPLPVKPMVKSSAVDYVINALKDSLMRNVIKPGDRLPSETELCQQLGVSRGSLRSAMKVFEALGVFDIRVGDGTYVCSALSSKNLNPLIFSLLVVRPDFQEFVQFRAKIELDIVELIIKDEKLTANILPKLKQNLDRMLQLHLENTTASDFLVIEKEFHHLLAEGCDNIIFQTVYSFIFEFFSDSIEDAHRHQDMGLEASKDHIRIFNAIKARDFSLAKTAILESMASWVRLVN